MVRSVICICLASCHLCSIKHCQPAHVSSPSHSASHHFWPISRLCCVWLSGWGRGGKTSSQTTAYVSNSPLCRPSPLLSWPPRALPSLHSSPRLSLSLALCVFLSPCPPNCPLDFLFVYLLACLSVAWQQAKTILQSMPITPWETTSNILYYMAAGSQLPTHTHTDSHVLRRNYLLGSCNMHVSLYFGPQWQKNRPLCCVVNGFSRFVQEFCSSSVRFSVYMFIM